MSRRRHQDDRSLTPKESEVFDLVLKGYSNRKIGETLFVSTDAIKFHLTSIFKKMQVKNRIQLILKTHKEKAS